MRPYNLDVARLFLADYEAIQKIVGPGVTDWFGLGAALGRKYGLSDNLGRQWVLAIEAGEFDVSVKKRVERKFQAPRLAVNGRK